MTTYNRWNAFLPFFLSVVLERYQQWLAAGKKQKLKLEPPVPQECIPKQQQQRDHRGNSFAVFFWILPQEYVLESGFCMILCWLLRLVSHMYLKYELCLKSLESLWNHPFPRKFHLSSPGVISAHQLWMRESGFCVLTGCNFWHFQIDWPNSQAFCMFFSEMVS